MERDWSKEEFLSECCMRAGLLADSSLDKEVKIYTFQTEVLSETESIG